MITAATTDAECKRLAKKGHKDVRAIALAELVKRGLASSDAQIRDNEKNKRALRRDATRLGGW